MMMLCKHQKKILPMKMENHQVQMITKCWQFLRKVNANEALEYLFDIDN